MYRIIQLDGLFYVQRQFLFLWITLRHLTVNGFQRRFFVTLRGAERAMFRMARRKRRKARVIGTYRIED